MNGRKCFLGIHDGHNCGAAPTADVAKWVWGKAAIRKPTMPTTLEGYVVQPKGKKARRKAKQLAMTSKAEQPTDVLNEVTGGDDLKARLAKLKAFVAVAEGMDVDDKVADAYTEIAAIDTSN